MEDVVAITARNNRGRRVAFMTWGRIYDRVDDEELLRVVKRASQKFAGSPMSRFELCWSLVDVDDHEYFYEALLKFAWRPIPSGSRYRTWVARMKREMNAGREIYFLAGRRSKRR